MLFQNLSRFCIKDDRSEYSHRQTHIRYGALRSHIPRTYMVIVLSITNLYMRDIIIYDAVVNLRFVRCLCEFAVQILAIYGKYMMLLSSKHPNRTAMSQLMCGCWYRGQMSCSKSAKRQFNAFLMIEYIMRLGTESGLTRYHMCYI